MLNLDEIPKNILKKYEFYDFNHAFDILTHSCKKEWSEILDCLEQLEISIDDLKQKGGNKSPIPKKFENFLYPLGWKEIRIVGDLTIHFHPRDPKRIGKFLDEIIRTKKIENYIDGHNIDFLKNRVAFDLEWNSKDQTFDRDLLAMRTYFDCDIISVGVIVTRSTELNEVFKSIKDSPSQTLMHKYGASTTHMDKLLVRLHSRRNGGCPILAIGIRKSCIEGWNNGRN